MKPNKGKKTKTSNQAQIELAERLSMKIMVKANNKFKINAPINIEFKIILECLSAMDNNSII
ncbi:hypothetical protein APV92_12300 [Staphylococcus aureus]|jgi:hypothetical protein|nr:hypothetical protein APV92_12300 [Staphylococcus aureus]